MRAAETNLVRRILLELGSGSARLFRQNVGMGWQGRRLRIPAGRMYKVQAGDVILSDARPLEAGLCKGSHDIIGWQSVTITPEMVGQNVAIFTSIEAKEEFGRVSKDQELFGKAVLAAGGLSGIARSVSDAAEILNK